MKNINIHEVGLRDGLQMEKSIVPTDEKLKWANLLSDSGIDIIQLGSFVHPKYVPQMADTAELIRQFKQERKSETIISGLVLNEKGLQRALDCGTEMICMGVSASETHSKKNTKMTTNEALQRIIKMAKEAESEGKKTQVSIQSAFGCGFEGEIKLNKVLKIAEEYAENGLKNLSLADTAGHAYPEQVGHTISNILQIDSSFNITCHFHDTYGLGLANIYEAIRSGVKTFETSFGGLGGCPFTKVAAGNVASEDFVHSLNRNGNRLDIRLEKIIETTILAADFLGKKLPSKLSSVKYLDY